MKNSIKIQNSFYHVEVITKESRKKEYVFRDSDLLLIRAKAFARMQYELENNSALSVNVFVVIEGEKTSLSSKDTAKTAENRKLEIAILQELGFSDWSRFDDLYDEELRQLVEDTEEKRQSVENAIKKMKEAVSEIGEAESLFEGDGFFFDWVAAIDKRVDVLETAFRSEIGYLKTA